MRRRLRFEQLEDRAMLAVDTWIGGSGNWSLASNWSGGVPTSATDAVIDTATAATITIATGQADTVHSLTVGANNTLSLPSGADPSNPTSNSITGNSGFESPVAATGATPPATWGYWGSSSLSSQYAYAGLQSLAVSGANSGVTQEFTVTPGAPYTASVYAMTPAGNPLTGNIDADLELLFFTSSGAQISPYSAPNQIALLSGASAAGGPLSGTVGNQGWNHFYTTAVAPSNAAKAKVQLVTYSSGGTFGGVAYFDAVKFGPSPPGPSNVATASLTNRGTIRLGPTNSIIVNGAFSQTSTGTIDAQLGGAPTASAFGSLAITGGATLSGTLKAELLYGYVPSTTDAFTPITYASQTGNFASVTLPSGAGYQFAAAASFTNVMLSAAPTTAVTSTISAATSLHPVPGNIQGVNLVWWDTADVSSQTQQLTNAAGFKLYRFPGGSSSDEYHFNLSANEDDPSAITIPQFAQFITSAGGTGVATLDYGSGSPQEAAAELAYLEGSATDSTVIGNGIEWNSTTNQWQTVNWRTAGYWAGLRGAAPLAADDGVNFLRIGHAAPFTSIKYWEVGNEEYGSWETDHHGTAGPGGASTGAQHDPATYVAFAKQFSTLASSILAAAGLPGIAIGIDSGSPTGQYSSWLQNILSIGVRSGFVPAFLSDHVYLQDPGNESDPFLLNNSVSSPRSTLNWSVRYSTYQTVLQQTLGSQAGAVQLLATEFNSVSLNPGKQTTSLVNGLFIANSLGSLLNSGYVGSTAWDLRNGWETSHNNSNQLYGWRIAGDYGMLGNSQATAPSTGTYVAYPNYFAEQLVSKIAGAGGNVVPATSNYGDLDVYAVMQSNGDLGLLAINTNPTANITDQFTITGFQPGGPAQIWQYGKAQDTAQSLSSNGASALASSSTTLNLTGASFSYAFPAYSMTVLDLKQAPTVASPAAAPSSIGGTTAALSALGGYNGGESDLTYTWSTTGTPPAPVTFSVNGSNAAKNTVATFSKAGTYTFQVTITDPAQLSTTSRVSVTVTQTSKSIALSLVSNNLATTGTEQFSASIRDQFGNPLASQPSGFVWMVIGNGAIDGNGRFTPTYASGNTAILAASGSLEGAAAISLPGSASWSASTVGSWNTSGNWQSSALGGNLALPGGRSIVGDTVLFQSGGGSTVNLSGVSPTLAGITFNNGAKSYTIAPGTGGTLQMNAGAGPASIQVAAGSHSITARMTLLSNLAINGAAGSALTIGSAISGVGKSLTKTGAGTLTLSGVNTFTGGIIVSGGSLIARTGASIGGTLTIGAGSRVTLAASDAKGNPLDDAAPAGTGGALAGVARNGGAAEVPVGIALAGPVDNAVSTPAVVASVSGSDDTIDAREASDNSGSSVNSNQVQTTPAPNGFWAGSLDDGLAADGSLAPSAETHAIRDALLAQQDNWTAVDC